MIGFPDIIFECNSRYKCEGCRYRKECYNKFQRSFDEALPSELWRSVTRFETLINYVNEWSEYQNEQAVKQGEVMV